MRGLTPEVSLAPVDRRQRRCCRPVPGGRRTRAGTAGRAARSQQRTAPSATPTVPPSANPVATTATSRTVRTNRTERPVRRCRPVIRPSRGPGPKLAEMYRPVATPFSTMPATSSGIRRPRSGRRHQGEGAVHGDTDHEHVGDRAEARALAQRDPQEQHRRAHEDRHHADRQTGQFGEPLVQRDFQGSRPRPDSTSRAELAPYSARPAYSWARRRGSRRPVPLGSRCGE